MEPRLKSRGKVLDIPDTVWNIVGSADLSNIVGPGFATRVSKLFSGSQVPLALYPFLYPAPRKRGPKEAQGVFLVKKLVNQNPLNSK